MLTKLREFLRTLFHLRKETSRERRGKKPIRTMDDVRHLEGVSPQFQDLQLPREVLDLSQPEKENLIDSFRNTCTLRNDLINSLMVDNGYPYSLAEAEADAVFNQISGLEDENEDTIPLLGRENVTTDIETMLNLDDRYQTDGLLSSDLRIQRWSRSAKSPSTEVLVDRLSISREEWRQCFLSLGYSAAETDEAILEVTELMAEESSWPKTP